MLLRPIRVLHLFERFDFDGVAGAWARAVPQFEESGIQLLSSATSKDTGWGMVQMSRLMEAFHAPLTSRIYAFQTVWNLAMELQADILHSHSESHALAVSFAGAFARLPVVRTYHEMEGQSVGSLKRRQERRTVFAVAADPEIAEEQRRWGPVETIGDWTTGGGEVDAEGYTQLYKRLHLKER